MQADTGRMLLACVVGGLGYLAGYVGTRAAGAIGSAGVKLWPLASVRQWAGLTHKEARMDSIDLARYELWRVDTGAPRGPRREGTEPLLVFGADVGLWEAVRAARAIIALLPAPALQLVATANLLGSAVVATLRENYWEAGPACTLARRVELDRIYQPDAFIGYTWRGLDVRMGFDGDCTEEQVIELAEECKGADYLCDEDDFEQMASELQEVDDEATVEPSFIVSDVAGDSWGCCSAKMALKTARVHAVSGPCTISKGAESLLTVYPDLNATATADGAKIFQPLIDSGL